MSLHRISVPRWTGGEIPSAAVVDVARSTCELTRPVTSSIPALLTGVVAIGGLGISSGTVIRASLAMGLTAMAGFVFDNIYDLPADRLAGQLTPLTQGRLSVPQARVIAAALAMSAIVLSPHAAASKLTISATLLALWFYSYAAHWAPWFKNAYSALLVCIPLFYGALIASVVVPPGYYFVLGLFVLGRESLIDLHQADADRKLRFRTLAILLGRSATSIFATIMMVVAGALLVLLAPGTAGRATSV